MEQNMDLSALAGQQIDPETFRRVWDRVMPDQRNSPIAVDRPAAEAPPRPIPIKPNPQTGGTAGQPAAPGPIPAVPAPRPTALAPRRPSMPQPPDEPKRETMRKDADRLMELMNLAQEGLVFSQALIRRAGNQAKLLSGLAADHRRALRQLSTAYFLVTGGRFQPKAPASLRPMALALALREQFLWEQRWTRTCTEAARQTADPALAELWGELAQDGALHTRAIRTALERMQGLPLD